MSKIKILFSLSAWITILPYLGFPFTLKNSLISLSGLALIFVTYLVYKEVKKGKREEKKFDNFSENHNFNENEIKYNNEIKENQTEF